MPFSNLPETLKKKLEKQDKEFVSWLKSWLRKEKIRDDLAAEVLISQLELHYHLRDQHSLFHLSENDPAELFMLHADRSLFDAEALQEFLSDNVVSYMMGENTFLLMSGHPEIIDKLKTLYHCPQEIQLCSTQVCLGPMQRALVRKIKDSPSETEHDVLIKMTFVTSDDITAHFECQLVQPKTHCSLSMLVSLLENFGLQVRKNYFYEIPEHHQWEINSFELESCPMTRPTDGAEIAVLIEEAMLQVIRGNLENDGLHQLIVAAGLNWRQTQLLRAWVRYLGQIKCPISFSYATELLMKHTDILKKIVHFFEWRFEPQSEKSKDIDTNDKQQQALISELENVHSSEADTLLRKLIELVGAMVRTNYYQRDISGEIKPWVSFKIDPHQMTELPPPVMAHEIFVYSAQGEGIHLRSSDIARGGLRWSDRIEDYRTEVLGLAKAQHVKNSIIVPSGAKGAFIVRQPPADPVQWQQAGIACYEMFVRGMLDITDNRRHGEIVTPPNVYCWDDPDPYLVVAADKGTATFSDRANALAAEYDFWLGDAFASGGSQGYDHKKLGITAKGAFVSAKHHLHDAQINPREQIVRAVGIGDMSGDVFGNGALLIPDIQWVAAFNHKHIFLDPTPHPKSHQERQRLFAQGPGSWDDFDSALISPGGGVFSRQQKFIPLSAEVQKMLGTTQMRLTPAALIAELLKLDVGMIFNGGIGTYVKAASENNADVGDRQNDSCRIVAEQMRCHIFVEGGNLGITQKGRIAFARQSQGRINTDTLDNSAGVDCSDHEVNIKILLQLAIEQGVLEPSERAPLLESLSGAICEKVLSHNRDQNYIISVIEHGAASDLLLHSKIIADLCQREKLNRGLEDLPSPKEIDQRLQSGQGLSRPELIILLAYIKLDLKERLKTIDLDKISLKDDYLTGYFPQDLHKRFGSLIARHPLADKIIICTLVNRFIDELGFAFFYRLSSETQAPVEEIFSAYSWVRDILNFSHRIALIRQLPSKVGPDTRYHLMSQLERLMYRAIRWVLRNVPREERSDQRREQLKELAHSYEIFLCRTGEDELKSIAECPEMIENISQHVPRTLWQQLCFFTRFVPIFALESWAPDDRSSWDYLFERYELTALTLKLSPIYEAVNALRISSEWEALARSELREQLEQRQVKITEKFYNNWAWAVEHQEFLRFWNQRVEAYFALSARDFSQTFVLVNYLELLLRAR